MADPVTERLNELAEKLHSGAKMHLVGAMAVGYIQQHIYKGDGFAPLSAATAAYRGAGKPLMDTGHGRDSITYQVKDDSTVDIGTTSAYLTVHNYGATITTKKNWLFIPAKGTRQLQRKYGYSPTEVLDGLRSERSCPFRIGRTICYKKDGEKYPAVVYYLKKSVTIPKREFWKISDDEMKAILDEVKNEYL